jgi:hypothetical protein
VSRTLEIANEDVESVPVCFRRTRAVPGKKIDRVCEIRPWPPDIGT